MSASRQALRGMLFGFLHGIAILLAGAAGVASADTGESGISAGGSSAQSAASTSSSSVSSTEHRSVKSSVTRGVRAESDNDDRPVAAATDRANRRAEASQGQDPKQSLSAMSADLARSQGGVETTPSAAAVAPVGIHGNPEANKQYLHQQGQCPTCVLMAVASVVGQLTGTIPGKEEIIMRATTTPSDTTKGEMIYQPGGTGDNGKHYGASYVDAVKLLDSYGIDAVESQYTKNQGQRALRELNAALDDHASVIVSIHAQSLYNGLSRRFLGRDLTPQEPGFKSGNHAISVTGVDENRQLVFVNDSNLPTGAYPIPLDLFLDVWKTSAYTTVIARPRAAATAPQYAIAA